MNDKQKQQIAQRHATRVQVAAVRDSERVSQLAAHKAQLEAAEVAWQHTLAGQRAEVNKAFAEMDSTISLIEQYVTVVWEGSPLAAQAIHMLPGEQLGFFTCRNSDDYEQALLDALRSDARAVVVCSAVVK